jgi:hypothetical protein
MRANRRSSLVLLLLLLLLVGGCSSFLVATGSPAPGAPLPLITSTPSDPTPATSATFRYSDSSSRADFRCSLDGAPFKACPAGGVTYTDLTVGAHQFRVEATRGRSTSEAATFHWTVISTTSYQPVRIPPATVPLPVGGGSSPSTSTAESPITNVPSNTPPSNSAADTSTPTTAPPASPTTSQPVIPTTTVPTNPVESPTVSGDLGALLYPGTSQVLDLVFTNPNSSSITVAANGVSIDISTNRAGCPAATNFSVERGLTTSVNIPANSTNSLAQLGIPSTDWPVIGMTETHTNQDACQGATLTLTYSVTVTG